MNKQPQRFRLKLNREPVRTLLDEYKKLNNIPYICGLNDIQRGDFEIWAMREAGARGIDLFSSGEYRAEVLKVNGKIMNHYNKR